MIAVRRHVLAASFSAAALLGGLVVAAGPAAAVTPNPFFCSADGDVTPCVSSASVQVSSNAPEPITATSTDFSVDTGECAVALDPNGGCQGGVAWGVNGHSGPLTTDQTWTITFNLGRFIPSGSDVWGVNTTVTRSVTGGRLAPDYHATVSGQPTLVDDGASCTEQGAAVFLCGERAPTSTVAFFGVLNDDFANEPAAQAQASYGLDDWTTSSATGAPLFLGSTPAGTITIPIGNTHEHEDGSVVQGEYNAFLPNALLEYMGIDDPSTITSASLAVSLESGNVTVTPSATGVTINLSDIIWPEPPGSGNIAGVAQAKRAKDEPLKIAPGVITPTRPLTVKAHRISATTGHFTFTGAKPRGSKIVHYLASCSATHHATKTGKSKSRKHLKVKGLSAGVGYRCKVRAVAKAGHGRWSKSTSLKR